jgi:hypothetical protein
MRLLLFLILISMLLGGCRKNDPASTSSFDLNREYGKDTEGAFSKGAKDVKPIAEAPDKPVANPGG